MFKQRGISLVELMVSITVGLVLMAGVVQLFFSSKVTFATQQAIARVQETGRLAVDFMFEDIRMAGFVGCMNTAGEGAFENLLNNSDTLLYNFAVPTEGIDSDEINASYPSHSSDSDVLLLRSANGTAVAVNDINDPDRIYIENTGIEEDGCDEGEDKYSGICKEDILVIADCTKARVFQVTEIIGSSTSERIELLHSDEDGFTPGNRKGEAASGNVATDKNDYFFSDAQVFVATSTFYYLDEGTSGRPSLFREINGESQELLTGVEQMQITYGLNGDFKAAKDVADWEQITSIRVELLVSSDDDNVLQDVQLYTFNGQEDQNPGDRRLRQVFSSTISIRSRTP